MRRRTRKIKWRKRKTTIKEERRKEEEEKKRVRVRCRKCTKISGCGKKSRCCRS